MSEMSLAERISIFNDMARKTVPNGKCAHAAQHFFKTAIMGLSDPSLLSGHPQMDTATRRDVQQRVLHGTATVVRSLTGAEFQTAVDYDTLSEQIPEHETGIRHTVRKVALAYGLTQPR